MISMIQVALTVLIVVVEWMKDCNWNVVVGSRRVHLTLVQGYLNEVVVVVVVVVDWTIPVKSC